MNAAVERLFSQHRLKKSGLICLFLILITLLSYWSYPAATLGEEDTQIYLAILLHRQDPLQLQRDIITQHPHTAFALFDEMVLFFGKSFGLDLPTAMRTLQLMFRFFLLLGFFLIARSLGCSQDVAAAVAALMMLGGRILGVQTLVVEYEPVPRGMAFTLVLLALALLSRRHLFSGTLLGCFAFCIHPTTTLPFWVGWAAILLSGRIELQNPQRLILAALPVSSTLLLSLSALQASPGEQSRYFLSFIDPEWERWLRLRTPYVFISQWGRDEFCLLLWAGVILWLGWWRGKQAVSWILKSFIQITWLWAWLMVLGSWVLLDHYKLALFPQVQPARALIFVVVFMLLLSWTVALTGLAACPTKLENYLWFISSLSFVLDRKLLLILWPLLGLEFWKNSCLKRLRSHHQEKWIRRTSTLAQLALTICLLGTDPFHSHLLTWNFLKEMSFLVAVALGAGILLSARWIRPSIGQPFLLGAIGLLFLILPKVFAKPAIAPDRNEIQRLATWAKRMTPPDAVFLFPDANQDKSPGVFRYWAGRAVYVDWKGGGQINFSRSFAAEWWLRWEACMARPIEDNAIQELRKMGIDYVVTHKSHSLVGVELVHQTESFNVYHTGGLQPENSNSRQVGKETRGKSENVQTGGGQL